MQLSQAQKNTKYRITEVRTDCEKLKNNFLTMGFYPGELVELKNSAPIFKDPLLFEISNNKIALTCQEASLLRVKLAEEKV